MGENHLGERREGENDTQSPTGYRKERRRCEMGLLGCETGPIGGSSCWTTRARSETQESSLFGVEEVGGLLETLGAKQGPMLEVRFSNRF
jgi:hypothetical protein